MDLVAAVAQLQEGGHDRVEVPAGGRGVRQVAGHHDPPSSRLIRSTSVRSVSARLSFEVQAQEPPRVDVGEHDERGVAPLALGAAKPFELRGEDALDPAPVPLAPALDPFGDQRDAVLLLEQAQAVRAPALVLADDIGDRARDVADRRLLPVGDHLVPGHGHRLSEQRLLRSEPPEHRPLRHPGLCGDPLQRDLVVGVVGEQPHRDVQHSPDASPRPPRRARSCDTTGGRSSLHIHVSAGDMRSPTVTRNDDGCQPLPGAAPSSSRVDTTRRFTLRRNRVDCPAGVPQCQVGVFSRRTTRRGTRDIGFREYQVPGGSKRRVKARLFRDAMKRLRRTGRLDASVLVRVDVPPGDYRVKPILHGIAVTLRAP